MLELSLTWMFDPGILILPGLFMQAIAFLNAQAIAMGPLPEVARRAKQAITADPEGRLLVFDADTSEPLELDLRGSEQEVLSRFETSPPKPGRPKLGVIAREVTLLPRHWEWLASQPGGASAALRRLVDEARRASAERDKVRSARESAYRFMTAMAGNEPGYEEAVRALFAGRKEAFERHTSLWPPDVRDHARRLAAPAME